MATYTATSRPEDNPNYLGTTTGGTALYKDLSSAAQGAGTYQAPYNQPMDAQMKANPSLTGSSEQWNKQPLVPSLADEYKNVQATFTPLDEATKASLRTSTEAQYAPRFQEQERLNKLRDTMFSAASAQRGDTGFGRSDLGYGGEVLTQQYGEQQVNTLRNLQDAEVQARISAAEEKNYGKQKDFLALANQFRQQQLDQIQQTFQNNQSLRGEARTESQQTYQRAQSTLNSITDLDPAQFAGLGDTSQLETTLGLPTGYINSLKATKEGAKTAANSKEFSEFFNKATQLALTTPAGQDFTLTDPITGAEYTFKGSEKDLQIVTDNGGIWSVDKNTNKVTELRAPTPPKAKSGTGTGTPALDTPITFNEWLGQKQNKEGLSYNTGDTRAMASLQKQYNDYATAVKEKPSAKYTANEIKKLEYAGLLNAPVAGQLEFLYKKKSSSDEDSTLDTMIANAIAKSAGK